MRTLLRTTLLALLLAAFGSFSAVPSQEPVPAARIPVVKTWKDLQGQAAIDLGGGVKIRLGISADRIPQWSGGFLYCLTEGYTPARKGSGRLPFGPVHATFTFGKVKKLDDHIKWASAQDKLMPNGSCLFVRLLPVDQVGEYQVAVTDPKGKVLAETVLQGTEDAYHPWMPWFFLNEVKGFAVSGPASGIARPCWDPFDPAAFAAPGAVMPGDLPTPVPTAPEPGFKIALDGDMVVIRSQAKFTSSRPEFHFLSRWWVNGKPYVPAQVKEFWLMDGYGLVSAGKELRVPLNFMPQRVGAKAGDKIGLQLLYCPAGWTWSTDGTRMNALGEPGTPWMSDRVEFIAADGKAK